MINLKKMEHNLLEYSINTTYEKKSIEKILDNILYFQSMLEINDIDISTNDYFKIRSKGKITSAIKYEPEYLKIITSKFIKSPKWTKEYEEENEKLLLEIRKLKEIYNNILTKKINKSLVDWILKHTLTLWQQEKFYKYYGIDYSIWKTYSNFRINLSPHDLDNWETWLFYTVRKINKKAFSLSQMNITEKIQKKFSIWEWLILISWPTGSAKSSTLVAILDWINKTEEKKILTVEDPIEFYWSWLQNKSTFRQREIWKSCRSFPDGIRQGLRQDPDIIVIWEIRDAETAKIAIDLAGTGHLVIATIHVKSTTASISRFLWFFNGDKAKEISEKLSTTLQFVLNQRLITTIEDKYKVAYEWLDPTKWWIKTLIQDNNLEDMRDKMYELDENWQAPHKTLNESLFEYIVTWQLTKEKAKELYSNEVNKFDKELQIYTKRYLKETWMKEEEVLEKILVAEGIEKRKNNKI